MTADNDERWRGVAENSRKALALLGYRIEPECLPGEANPCGGTYAEHFASNLAALKAVADHHLMHLGVPFVLPIYGTVYETISADLDSDCPSHTAARNA